MFLLLCISMVTKAQDSVNRNPLYQMFIAAHPIDTGRSSQKLFVVPIFGHTPEGGYEYGIATFKNFTLPSNKNARTSFVTAKASFTSRHAANFIGYGEFWSKQNSFFWNIDVRHQEFPFYFYGVGNNTNINNAVLMEERLSHINVEAAKEVLKHYYIGLNGLLEKQVFSIKDTLYQHKVTILPNERKGSYLNLGLTQMYDSRDNTQFSTSGIYAYLKLSFYPKIERDNDFTGTQVNFNFKAFTTPIDRLTFGYNVVYNAFGGKIAPFYMLQQMGNDQIMRGFYAGRFRDKKMLAHQLEARYHFIERMAVTAFIGNGATTPRDWNINQFRTSYGAGLRYFFDVKQRSTIRLDYAITQRLLGEKRQTGVYVTLGEAF